MLSGFWAWLDSLYVPIGELGLRWNTRLCWILVWNHGRLIVIDGVVLSAVPLPPNDGLSK